MRPGQTARYLFVILVALLAPAAAHAQPSFAKTFAPSTIGPGSVSTAVFTITNGSGIPVTELAFTDNLPGPVTIADPANVLSTCDLAVGGSISAPAGGSTITLTDGQVGGGATCTIAIDVTSTTVGMHTNPAITLSSSAGSSMSTAVDLAVATDRPGFSKSFSPSTVPLGGRSTLTLTVDNSANASDLSSLVFTDNFPGGMIVADPANASTDCGGPNPQLTVGADFVAFSSFGLLFPGFEVLLAGATCTVVVDVVTTAGGALENVTSDLTSNVGSSGKSSDTLDVTTTTLALDKDFLDDPVAPGGTALLEFTIRNFDRDFAATGVTFTDDLAAALAGLTFDSLNSNDCGGSVTTVGTTTLTLTGGTVPAQGSCSIQVALAVPLASAPGVYVNTTGVISGTINGSPSVGNMASDPLFVSPAPVITKTYIDDPVNPGDPVTVEFTITNTSVTSSATDIAFMDLFPTVTPTASMTPADGCCGAGSTCMFSPLVNPPPPSDVIPATFTLSGGTLEPAGMAGDSCTFQVTLDVEAGAAAGIYPNTTTEITATVDGETRTGEAATDDMTIVSAPKLSKEFTDDPAVPGGTVTLEFTLNHPADAPTAATDITFTDDLAVTLTNLTATLPPSPDPPCGVGSSLTASAGDTLLTLMGGSLMPGEDCTFSVTLNVPADATAGTHANTTSGVSAMVDGLVTTSAPATDDLLVSGLMVMKEFIGSPVLPNQNITMRFTFENSDPVNDATSITFTDDLSFVLPGVPDLTVTSALPINACGGTLSQLVPGFLIFSAGTVMAGDPPCVLDVELLVPSGASDGFFTNTTGNITAVINGGLTVLPPATGGFEINTALLSLAKEFTDDPVQPGNSVNLRFTLTNLDGGSSASSLAFTDNLAAALPGLVATGLPFAACGGMVEAIPDASTIAFSGGSLGPGGECSFDVSVDVPGSTIAGDYTNVSSEITGLLDGVFPVDGGVAIDTLEVLDLLTFSKSFDGPTVAGGTPVLNFIITNPGTSTVSSIAFSDDLDAVLTGLVATNLPLNDVCGAGSVLSGTDFITLTGASLPPMGGTCAFAIDLQMPMVAVPGDYPNVTSELSAAGLEVSPPATDDLTVLGADLAITKTDGVTTATPGASVVYTIVATNNGPDPASDVTVMDTFPAILSCSWTSVAAGGATGNTDGSGDLADALVMPVSSSVTYTVTCSIPSGATGTLSNTATIVDAVLGDVTPGNNSATDDDTVLVPQADLSVTKTDGVTSAVPGQDLLTYTIVASNGGPSDDPAVTLTDMFPADLTCTYTSVAAGGATGNTAAGAGDLSETLSMPSGSSVTYTATCTIDPAATGTLSNTATVTASVSDPVPGNDSATDDDTVLSPEADLGVTKTDGVTSATPGGSLTYTIVASNAGPSDDPAVSLTDTFPADLTCTYTSVAAGGATGNTAAGAGDLSETLSLPSGASVTYTINCSIASSATGTLSNTATVSGSATDNNAANDSATDDDTVLVPEADLGVTKTDGVMTATPGGQVTYTIVVSNAGPSDDPSASLADIFPADLTCTYTSVAAGGATGNTAAGAGDLAETLSLPAGSSVTYTATCDIASSATGTLSNTATVTSSVTDGNAANDSATDDDTVLVPEADLEVTKTDGVTSATPGGTVTYTIVGSNLGPSDDPAAALADIFPADLTCTYTSVAAGGASGNTAAGAGDLSETLSLPAGSSVTYTATCDIDPAATGTLSNTATVTSSVTDGNAANNSATDDDTVLEPEADLAVEKTGPPTITVGNTLTYSIEVTNNGPSVATVVMLDDPTPTGLTFLTATAPCAGGFPCDLGTLADGASVTIDVDFDVPGTYAGPKPIENTATVSSAVTDPNSANDSSTASTDVVLDGEAPQVMDVLAAGQPLTECETIRQPITLIEVKIEDVTSPIEGADDVANYLLVASGPDGDFSTAACGAVAGDDVEVPITGVSASGTLVADAELAVGGAIGLDPGLYRFFVCDTIVDAAGNALDGDNDGNPGGDFVVPFFRADPSNLFENGHFDDCPASLAPWMINATPPNLVQTGLAGLDDVEGSPLSTSARVIQTAVGGSSLGQCVTVAGTMSHQLSASARFVPTDAVAVNLVSRCELFDGPACGGSSLDIVSTTSLLEDEGGIWVDIQSEVALPAGSISALCDFAVESAAGGPAFDLYLDALFFGVDSLIFADGFESGDTSAWSESFP